MKSTLFRKVVAELADCFVIFFSPFVALDLIDQFRSEVVGPTVSCDRFYKERVYRTADVSLSLEFGVMLDWQ
jgi:hypothetical protein